SLCRNKRDLIVDQHDRSEFHQPADFTRGEHRYSNTSMTSRLCRHVVTTMNCNTAADVIGEVHRAENIVFPTHTFLVNDKPAAWCVGYARLTVVNKRLSGSG